MFKFKTHGPTRPLILKPMCENEIKKYIVGIRNLVIPLQKLYLQSACCNYTYNALTL